MTYFTLQIGTVSNNEFDRVVLVYFKHNVFHLFNGRQIHFVFSLRDLSIMYLHISPVNAIALGKQTLKLKFKENLITYIFKITFLLWVF